jgi:hypothetical protein
MQRKLDVMPLSASDRVTNQPKLTCVIVVVTAPLTNCSICAEPSMNDMRTAS